MGSSPAPVLVALARGPHLVAALLALGFGCLNARQVSVAWRQEGCTVGEQRASRRRAGTAWSSKRGCGQ